MERQSSADPRPPLQARYANRAAYEAKVRSAAAAVVAQGFLLPEDVDALVGEAGGLFPPLIAHHSAQRGCEEFFCRSSRRIAVDYSFSAQQKPHDHVHLGPSLA